MRAEVGIGRSADGKRRAMASSYAPEQALVHPVGTDGAARACQPVALLTPPRSPVRRVPA